MRARRRIKRVAAAVGVGWVASILSVPVAAAEEVPDISGASSVWQIPDRVGPAQSTHPDAARYARQHPGSVPPGVNDFTCTSTGADPRPVVLVHGTDSNAYSDWAALGPRLAASGHCVFALNYGGEPGGESYGTEDITVSAGQLAQFVAQVRGATGACEVDIVGYSQGATVARYYINRLGGAAAVEQWIGLASPTYGGTMFGLVPVLEQTPGGMAWAVAALPPELVSPALVQQAQGSPLLDDLNGGGDTVPGTRYTTIGSRIDEVIQPATNIALRDRSATNLMIQDLCPLNQSGHFRMPYDEYTLQLVMGLLDPATAVTPPCTVVPAGAGVLDMILTENF
ncbi:alpha/beta fold hydrolase (plasmid) [Rhodococcus sp. ZPP]|uniref:esterase/lipase family protein n=1 Tax=Rhodococcus TaxID=1827 RepID=UPI0006BB4B58|nr:MULTISPECIES: alpha/beta fold hydrolase [Rhodococcus]QHE73762.1 putative lipase [Rhodococcus sp. WAY2]QTJ71107.1 alpha/beta fold hydrolase [Rhodococcus sp. ZPP]